MKTFEYRILIITKDIIKPLLEKCINTLSIIGWELIGIVPDENCSDSIELFLKRQKY